MRKVDFRKNECNQRKVFVLLARKQTENFSEKLDIADLIDNGDRVPAVKWWNWRACCIRAYWRMSADSPYNGRRVKPKFH